MHLVTNSVTPTDVTEDTRNGDRYLIINSVPFLRAQQLSGGYVPHTEVKQSVNDWAGVPLTANHPRDDDGHPVPANTKLGEVGVGTAENPSFDGEYVRVDMAVNADRAQAMGGPAADIVAKLEDGEQFDVSSQYIPRQLPEGEYDGEQRANVEGIQTPDSIALLPNKTGFCDWSDGCGINPSGVTANAADLPGVRVPTTADDPSGEDGGFRETMQDTLDDSDPESVGRRVLNALGFTANDDDGDGGGRDGGDTGVSETDTGDAEAGNEAAESATETPCNTMDDDKRQQLINELTANSAVTERALEDACDERVQLLHEDLVANTDDTGGGHTTSNDGNAGDYVTEEELDAKLDGLADDIAEQVSANTDESEKDALAEQIVANSAEYDDAESVRDDYPTRAALETKAEQVSSAGGSVLPGAGASQQVANNTTDDDIEVSAGVLTNE